jgi:capsule polysaccharide export protein KpsC/LpsZ
MKEGFVLTTTQLWTSNDIVHVIALGLDGKEIYLEWDANSLLNDIPSLYEMSKQALTQANEHRADMFAKMKRQIGNDFKAKRGRKPKNN